MLKPWSPMGRIVYTLLEMAEACAAKLMWWRTPECFTSAHMDKCVIADDYALHLMCCPGGKKCPVRMAKAC